MLTSAPMRDAAGGRKFGTTQWSLVLAAGERGSAAGEVALERLCSLYWNPIFAYVRRRGYSSDEAADLTQGFFARLIEKGDLASADRSRGRFRTFLLSACQHFLANQWHRSRAQKRGGDRSSVSLDVAAADRSIESALAHNETPEVLYERQWCRTLLAGVLDDLREEYQATGRGKVFEGLKRFLTGDHDPAYAEAARELAITPGAVKVAVHRLRNRYRDALRERVAATVASEDEVADEIRHLLKTLGGGSGGEAPP